MINTTLLAEKFSAIKGATKKESDMLFRHIRTASNSADKCVYSGEDIKGICVMNVLKKCSWLSGDSKDDCIRVTDFISLMFEELKKNTAYYDDREFYALASIVIEKSYGI